MESLVACVKKDPRPFHVKMNFKVCQVPGDYDISPFIFVANTISRKALMSRGICFHSGTLCVYIKQEKNILSDLSPSWCKFLQYRMFYDWNGRILRLNLLLYKMRNDSNNKKFLNSFLLPEVHIFSKQIAIKKIN